MYRHIYFIVAVFGALAIFLGAFSAHGLEHDITVQEAQNLQTAARYHMWHVIASIAIIALIKTTNKKSFIYVIYLFLIGIVLFSGSLYLLSIDRVFNIEYLTGWLGPITPIGGLCFIIGWLLLAFTFLKMKK